MYIHTWRYLPIEVFIDYCNEFNLVTNEQELEHYEKIGVMIPMARVIYPDDHRVPLIKETGRHLKNILPSLVMDLKDLLNRCHLPSNSGSRRHKANDKISLEIPKYEIPLREQPSELQRLLEPVKSTSADYARMTDDELVDRFDREMGLNQYLIRPEAETYKPWASYRKADHYFCYWQVHQLHKIRDYPDLYENVPLLENISQKVMKRFSIPRAPDPPHLRGLWGKAHFFDALSFWITLSSNEQDRAFALIPAVHQVKHLDGTQNQALAVRLKADAALVQKRFQLTIDELYTFLDELLEMRSDYRRVERNKLADELSYDISALGRFIHYLTDLGWDAIADELGNRYTFWTKQSFRHLNIVSKELDEARDVLVYFAKGYVENLGKLHISSPSRAFSGKEIDDLLDYCGREGLLILITSLSGMTYAENDYAAKNRRVIVYSNIKNSLTAFEFMFRDLGNKNGLAFPQLTLKSVVETMMNNETAWIDLFKSKVSKGLTSAKDVPGFFNKLNQLLGDPDLFQSEDAYIARVFLVACLVRNLTAHTYPDEDWFFGDLFGEMMRATIYALLYSWQVAKREGWV